MGPLRAAWSLAIASSRARRTAMSAELRRYQIAVIDEVDRIVAAGQRCVLLVAPTGSGKAIIAARIIRNAVEQGKRVLIFAHRREIVGQTFIGKSKHSCI